MNTDTAEQNSASDTEISSDHLLAADLAKRAGELLVDLRAETCLEMSSGAGVAYGSLSRLKAEGDRKSHEFLTAELQTARPDDIVLSEEGRDDPRRLSAKRVWIIDPLDGTREFGEPPRDDWAVHVALLEDGELKAGAVALPAIEMTLSTADPPLLPPPLPPSSPSAAETSGTPNSSASSPRSPGFRSPRVIVSRSRPGPVSLAICMALEGELISLGSAGAKAMAVVLGHADIYAHTGGQYEWDSAAPAAVARAAGCHTSRMDGSPLRYNQADPYLPDLLICRPEWADQALAIAAQIPY